MSSHRYKPRCLSLMFTRRTQVLIFFFRNFKHLNTLQYERRMSHKTVFLSFFRCNSVDIWFWRAVFFDIRSNRCDFVFFISLHIETNIIYCFTISSANIALFVSCVRRLCPFNVRIRWIFLPWTPFFWCLAGEAADLGWICDRETCAQSCRVHDQGQSSASAKQIIAALDAISSIHLMTLPGVHLKMKESCKYK